MRHYKRKKKFISETFISIRYWWAISDSMVWMFAKVSMGLEHSWDRTGGRRGLIINFVYDKWGTHRFFFFFWKKSEFYGLEITAVYGHSENESSFWKKKFAGLQEFISDKGEKENCIISTCTFCLCCLCLLQNVYWSCTWWMNVVHAIADGSKTCSTRCYWAKSTLRVRKNKNITVVSIMYNNSSPPYLIPLSFTAMIFRKKFLCYYLPLRDLL